MTKPYIEELKHKGGLYVASFVKKQTDAKSINFILESLGRLPNDFESDFLFDLLANENASVRLNAVKNIGKLNANTDFSKLIEVYQTETDTHVRREIISALGRQKAEKFIDFFINTLNDIDPKIVLQAIRSLFVFDNKPEIKEVLLKMVNHSNEMVRNVIYKQYYSNKEENHKKLPHSETYGFLKNTVINSDVLEALKLVPDESIHLTFTSPPYYNARDYSIYPSYEDYLDFLEKVFRETHRITKEGRFLIVNTSPIIIPRVSRAHSSKRYGIPFDLHNRIVENGWEFIDDIIWLKPETSVKNRIGGFMQHRKPLGYKPNTVTEYLMVYRKQTSKLLDWNIRSYSQEIIEKSKVGNGYETSNVWRIDPVFDKVHSAVFPSELCKRVIQYYSYIGDLVFDPFGGSGTVGKVAQSLGRYFFLTEQNHNYFEHMKTKINTAPTIFNDRMPKFLSLDDFKKEINL